MRPPVSELVIDYASAQVQTVLIKQWEVPIDDLSNPEHNVEVVTANATLYGMDEPHSFIVVQFAKKDNETNGEESALEPPLYAPGIEGEIKYPGKIVDMDQLRRDHRLAFLDNQTGIWVPLSQLQPPVNIQK